jgi:ribosomal protein S27E
MPKGTNTPSHCPGFENFRNLSSFLCKCPECGNEVEIFSDEFDRAHQCKKCGKPIDFTQCSLDAQGGDPTAR